MGPSPAGLSGADRGFVQRSARITSALNSRNSERSRQGGERSGPCRLRYTFCGGPSIPVQDPAELGRTDRGKSRLFLGTLGRSDDSRKQLTITPMTPDESKGRGERGQ